MGLAVYSRVNDAYLQVLPPPPKKNNNNSTLQDSLLELVDVLDAGVRVAEGGEVLHDVLGGLRLTGTRLTRHNDGLRLLGGLHAAISIVGWMNG